MASYSNLCRSDLLSTVPGYPVGQEYPQWIIIAATRSGLMLTFLLLTLLRTLYFCQASGRNSACAPSLRLSALNADGRKATYLSQKKLSPTLRMYTSLKSQILKPTVCCRLLSIDLEAIRNKSSNPATRSGLLFPVGL